MFKLESVIEIMQKVKIKAGDSFMGLGLIVYRDISSLPVIPLGNKANSHSQLPMYGSDEIAKLLAKIAESESPWHDGFHLMSEENLVLTHISQYFSPPLDIVDCMPAHMGARQMAALLGSKLRSVECIILINRKCHMSIFKNGNLLGFSKNKI